MASEDQEVRITLRMPSRLRDQLIEAAKVSNRSMNAEIVHRLEGSFAFDKPPAGEQGEFLELPEGVTVNDFADALELASRQAMDIALRRLGIERRPFDDSAKDDR